MTRNMRGYIWTGVFFGLMTILFALLYYFNVIKNMSLVLAVVYVTYFVGLALFYNGAYCRKQAKTISSTLCMVSGGAFVVASTVLLIYGFCAGLIVF